MDVQRGALPRGSTNSGIRAKTNRIHLFHLYPFACRDMQSLPLPLEIKSDQYDGKTRRLRLRFCVMCGVHLYIPFHVERRCCSNRCSQLKSRDRLECKCAWCNATFELSRSKASQGSKSGLKFCSRSCKDTAQQIGGLAALQLPHYNNGVRNYRAKALRHYGSACCKCGYANDVRMLDVDHIDSDRDNNEVDNLQVMCVWCHACKTRKVLDTSR
jgi:hypothetical protein